MDCTKYNEWISLSMDGMLTDDEQKQLNEHLENCPQCKEDYKLYMSISDGLNTLEEADLPEDFHNSLMARIKAEGTVETESEASDQVIPLWKRMNRQYMNVAAAFVLVVVFALIGVNNLEQNSRTTNDLSMEEPEMALQEMAPAADQAEQEKMAESRMMDKAASPEEALDEMEVDEDATLTVSFSLEEGEAADVAEVNPTASEEVVEGVSVEPQMAKGEEAEVGTPKVQEHEPADMDSSEKEQFSEPKVPFYRNEWYLIGGILAILAIGSFIIIRYSNGQ